MLNWLKSDVKIDDMTLDNSFVEIQDFLLALSLIMPTAKREGFATVPDVTWKDVGALRAVREELEWSILVNILFVYA